MGRPRLFTRVAVLLPTCPRKRGGGGHRAHRPSDCFLFLGGRRCRRGATEGMGSGGGGLPPESNGSPHSDQARCGTALASRSRVAARCSEATRPPPHPHTAHTLFLDGATARPPTLALLGLHRRLAPCADGIFTVGLQAATQELEGIPDTQLRDIEADVFWCFSKLLDSIQVCGGPHPCLGWNTLRQSAAPFCWA